MVAGVAGEEQEVATATTDSVVEDLLEEVTAAGTPTVTHSMEATTTNHSTHLSTTTPRSSGIQGKVTQSPYP
jgi:hypothetical protein